MATTTSADPDTVVDVRDLRVVYDRTPAVDGIDFTVRRGEVFGLLGTNGAGKTTTLDVLEGYRSPTEGQVSVLGLDPRRDRDQLAPRVGIMLQDAGFFDTLTVRQTIKAWRRFHAAPRALEDATEQVGLQDRLDVRVNRLSGGERRRLDLALALLGRPEVLFLDEPTTGMDPQARARCLDLVRDLVDDGTTVVLTTHYLEEAEQLADRVVIMNGGRIVRSGTLEELRASDGRSRISFGVDPTLADSVPAVGTVTIDRHPRRADVCVTTDDPQGAVAAVTAWAAERGTVLHDLEVHATRLEEVFLGAAEASTSAPSDTPSDTPFQRPRRGGAVR